MYPQRFIGKNKTKKSIERVGPLLPTLNSFTVLQTGFILPVARINCFTKNGMCSRVPFLFGGKMSDLIRREDVYDVLKKVNITGMPIYVFDKLWNGIRDLPSVEPEVKTQYIAGELNGLKSKTVW